MTRNELEAIRERECWMQTAMPLARMLPIAARLIASIASARRCPRSAGGAAGGGAAGNGSDGKVLAGTKE